MLIYALMIQAAVGSVPAAAETKPDDIVRCRRIAVTGSIVRKERVCRTVGEWRRMGEYGNGIARGIVDQGRSPIFPR